MPVLVEEKNCPDKELEETQTIQAIKSVMSELSVEQQEIISLAYGLNGEKPLSINKICKEKNISRVSCIKIINSAFEFMKEHIKI